MDYRTYLVDWERSKRNAIIGVYLAATISGYRNPLVHRKL